MNSRHVLDVLVFGLGRDALFSAEVALLHPDVRVIGVLEPDQHRRTLLSHQLPCIDSIDTVLNESPYAVVLLDATLADAESLFQRWIHSGGALLVTGTEALTSQQLANWLRCAESTFGPDTASRVGIVPAWPMVPESVLAEEALRSGQLGPLRLARWTSQGLLGLGQRPPARTGQSLAWLTARLWPITASLHSWGYSLVRKLETRVAVDGAPSAVVTSLWLDSGGQRQMTLIIDLDEATRVARAPGWSLEGDRGSYCDGVVYHTTPVGEIVDIPQTLPSVTGHERLLAALAAVANRGPQPMSLDAATRSLAWAETLATPG